MQNRCPSTNVFHQRPKRDGWSLIEMMLLITLITMLGVMGGQIIMLLMEADGKLASSTMVELTVQRLEDQFRTDVESAVSIQQVDGELHIQLLNEHTLVYRIEGESVIRIEPHGKRQIREDYRFAEFECSFSQVDDVVRVQISPQKDSLFPARTDVLSNSPQAGISVRASLGRRLRRDAQREATS